MQSSSAAAPDTSSSVCFHCGLPVPAGLDLTIDFDGASRPVCCRGCQSVAHTIIDYGLADYYRHRTATANTVDDQDLIPEQLRVYDDPRLQKGFVQSLAEGQCEASLMLEDITCPACLWLNEQHLRQLDGVVAADINYSTHRARVRWDPQRIELSRILAAIREIGYSAFPYDAEQEEKQLQKEQRQQLRRLGIAGLFGMQIMMIAVTFYTDMQAVMEPALQSFLRWVSLLLVLPVIGYSAQPFFQAAWRDISNHRVGMDVPVTLGIGLAFAASLHATITGQGEIYYDSVAMFVFLLLLGRFMEFRVRRRAIERADRLKRIMPATARRIDSQGNRVEVPVFDIHNDDRLFILPGETVPADGVILKGASALDEAMLTGEYLPKLRKEGDSVIGGSINVDNALTIRVTGAGDDSLQARIQRLVDRAQAEKPRITRIADRVAGWFVMVVLVLAALTALTWLRFDPQNWLPVTVAVLVVSCPCALSLATPTALTASLAGFMQRGLAVTRAAAIEYLTRVSHVAFDKTGTLTRGRLALRRIETFAALSRAECLKLAAVLESQSEHPIATALTDAYGSQSMILPLDIRNQPGAGIAGTIDGHRYYIGKPEFIESSTGLACRRPLSVLSKETAESVILLADDEKLLAAFVLIDSLRVGARELIDDIHRAGRDTVLLSGDQQQVVRSVGSALGIGDCRSGLSPDDKLDHLRTLQHQGAVVAMVGDGINDAPVLAAANVSIVMRRGADISRGQADILMLGEDIRCLADGIRLADRTARVIRQNIVWALGYNLIALPLAMLGYVEPWMAAVGMSGSSLLVLANSSRLGAKSR